MSKHRAALRPRWGRIALSTGAAGVLTVALVGALAGFSSHGDTAQALDPAISPAISPAAVDTPAAPVTSAAPAAPVTPVVPTTTAPTTTAPVTPDPTALPAGSGTGRRAVYDISDQRVWIVGADGSIERTYLVSGSREDNLKTGTYHVYSRTMYAEGVDDTGYMRYFVRFAYGTDQGASIGFHEIPTTEPDDKGEPLQTLKQLGTPESHGCIRQKTADAAAMWDFAQVGTKVVVLA